MARQRIVQRTEDTGAPVQDMRVDHRRIHMVVADLQDPSGSYPETTGATETADRLYVQNLHLHSIGWLAR